MKNRYLKNARIPERKVRELLNLFCEDLTATQIANISGVSRITVNAYLKMIRTHIAEFCEEQNPLHPRRPRIERLAGHSLDTPSHESISENQYYGMFRYDQSIFTSHIQHVDESWLNNWLRGKILVERAELEKNDLASFEAIADFGRARLFRVNTNMSAIKGKSKIDEIDLFWGILKSRIVKFRGLNTGTTYLHVKESEFRYNNRNSDLFAIVHALIQKRPLHLRQEGVIL